MIIQKKEKGKDRDGEGGGRKQNSKLKIKKNYFKKAFKMSYIVAVFNIIRKRIPRRGSKMIKAF